MFSYMTEEMYEDVFLYRQNKLKNFLTDEILKYSYESNDCYNNETILVNIIHVIDAINKFRWNHLEQKYELR